MLTLQKNTEEDSQMMDFQGRKNSLLEEPQFQKLMIRRNRSENRKTGVNYLFEKKYILNNHKYEEIRHEIFQSVAGQFFHFFSNLKVS